MVLDTNTYSALAQGEQSIIEVIRAASELKLPLPVIAELRYGFAKGSRKDYNEQILERFLAQSQVSILEPTLKTTEIYAELQLYCVQKGKVLSHNDLWIAALSREANDVLVTYDKDFSIFAELLHTKLLILE